MFGRRCRTHLPVTDKHLGSQHAAVSHDALVAAKSRQEHYYNRGARERPPLAVGNTVRTRWDQSDDWRKATVVEVLPHRSYRVQFDDGSIRRRTSKHVRFSREAPLIMRDDIEPLRAVNTRQAAPAATATQGDPPPPPTTHRSPPPGDRPLTSVRTRSGRPVHQPARYKDYVCSATD